ncbi:transposase family protein [Pontibacter sp. HSC-14F20]|uniref:transposase family protein n=1 Tax=Pontibacter sp. HSC-14F20 TaxID=2864136 RepID=UPI001C73921D|nr:transposase family protein [Pontibacter sp. HSC-14F20]MBX0335050.1 transposase family protein [Pontibacter sp. HSC-14F20]
MISFLREVADPRRQAGLRHALAETLCMVVMGMMSGCCAYRELGRFVHHNRQELVAFLGLAKARVPSYVPLRDILQRLDFEALSRAFSRWSGQYVDWSGRWLSVEGKSLRSTVSSPATTSAASDPAALAEGRHVRGGQVPHPQGAENRSLLLNVAINLMRSCGFGSLKEATIALANKIGKMNQITRT